MGVRQEFSVERTVLTSRSAVLHQRAEVYSPGGCAKGDATYFEPYPIYFRKGFGANLWDVDGNVYLDMQGGPGPHVLGHAFPEIVDALVETMQTDGVYLGQPHPSQVELAELFCRVVPSAEMVMFSGGGGTDVLYHAVRVSRAHTGRPKVAKLEGGFHGWQDWSMISVAPRPEDMGPYDTPRSVPDTDGISAETLANTVVLHANDEAMLEKVLGDGRHEIGCLVLEPVIHAMGAVPLTKSYIRLARELCDAYGIVLVFDELLTGFRHALGGAQSLLGVMPDLAAFGKAWTNGCGVLSAIAGKTEIMSHFTPAGNVSLSGSYGANLLGVTAALKCIQVLERDGDAIYKDLFRRGAMVTDGINAAARRVGVRARCHNFGSIWIVYPFDRDVQNYRDLVAGAHPDEHRKFVWAFCTWLMNHGIFIRPAGGGRGRAFLSAAHTDDDVERVIGVVEKFFREYRAQLQ